MTGDWVAVLLFVLPHVSKAADVLFEPMYSCRLSLQVTVRVTWPVGNIHENLQVRMFKPLGFGSPRFNLVSKMQAAVIDAHEGRDTLSDRFEYTT